jgi:heterotetrameric sarcosine oxidase delta subunit
MLIIHCAVCGPRSREEFAFGGEAPNVPDHVVDPAARNLDYVWFYDNVEGPSTERWFHTAGCHRWTTVRRDTRTDRVLGDRVLGE